MRSTVVRPYCNMTFTNITACFPQVNYPKQYILLWRIAYATGERVRKQTGNEEFYILVYNTE
jgi:hypothetical protein